MKKFIASLFNLAIYAMLLWAVLSAVYMALDPVHQETFSFMTKGIALVGGSSTFLLGSGGLTIKHFLNKTENENAKNYFELAGKFVTLAEKHNQLEKKFDKKISELLTAVEENTKVSKAQLELKLDNKFIGEQAKMVVNKIMSGGGKNDEEANDNL